MARQFQIPGGPYVNLAEDGREFQLPGYGYVNEAVAAGSATLSADAGSYVVTGAAAKFDISQSTSTGSYSQTGAASSFDILLNAAAGSYAITGADADLIATGVSSYTLSADAGSYTITGQPAIFDITQSSSAGSYSQTGQASAFDVSLLANAGSYTVTGADADLIAEISYTLSAEAGSYTITGVAADLIATGQEAERVGGGIGHAAKKSRYKTKKQKVWLVEVDDKEYEVEDLDEIKPIVAKKLAKGKKPEVKAKPLTENPREAATAYTQQAWLTEYVPMPVYEKRLNFVDILPYIIAMREMEEEEEILLLAA